MEHRHGNKGKCSGSKHVDVDGSSVSGALEPGQLVLKVADPLLEVVVLLLEHIERNVVLLHLKPLLHAILLCGLYGASLHTSGSLVIRI
jgi:hypothetical protein